MRLTNILSGFAFWSTVSARDRITFYSSGVQIVGYHYPPTCYPSALSTTSTGKLRPFAERFAAAGYHAITSDYRFWGESGGLPRNLANIDYEQADYRAAIIAGKKMRGVDRRRIILWGTSLSGGMALNLGGRLYNDSSSGVVAVISQVPMVNGQRSSALTPPAALPGIVERAVADQARVNITLAPIYIPTCNHTGELGLLTSPGSWEGCVSIEPNPPPPVYGNISTRIALQIPFFIPDAIAANSNLVTYIGIAMDDDLVSVPAAQEWAAKMPCGTVREFYGAGHFDVYPGHAFYEENVAAQVDFLQQFVRLRNHGRKPATHT